MNPSAFNYWLGAMKLAGLATSDAAAARLLGISANAVVRIKQQGSSDGNRTALACSALLHGLEPYGQSPDNGDRHAE